VDAPDKTDALPPSDRALEIENRDLKAENDRLRKQLADEDAEEDRALEAHDDEPDDDQIAADEDDMGSLE